MGGPANSRLDRHVTQIMDDWLQFIAASCALDPSAASALHNDGFAVIDGPVPATKFGQLSGAYDRAMREANPHDVSIDVPASSDRGWRSS